MAMFILSIAKSFKFFSASDKLIAIFSDDIIIDLLSSNFSSSSTFKSAFSISFT